MIIKFGKAGYALSVQEHKDRSLCLGPKPSTCAVKSGSEDNSYKQLHARENIQKAPDIPLTKSFTCLLIN